MARRVGRIRPLIGLPAAPGRSYAFLYKAVPAPVPENPISKETPYFTGLYCDYLAVKGGAMDCPYTFMQDMVAGTFRLPWEDQVKVTDGTSCGFPAPTRVFGAKAAKAAE